MRYGVSLPNFGEGVDARTMAGLASEAEEAGWDGFFLWDHLLAFSPGPVPVVDPWVALTAAALSTSRVRLGPMLTPLPRRRPVKLARETASLDRLSGGRLTLGVGIGAMPFEYDYLGEEPDMRTRGAMLDEGLEVLTGLWTGEPFGYRGEHYRVGGETPNRGWRAVLFYPPPLQRPRIPVWVAGTWPAKPPFRRAARWDGAFPMKVEGGRIVPMAPEEAREVARYVAGHRTSDDPFDLVVAGESPGDDRKEGARTVVAAYEEVGVTWWIESIDPWRFGWTEGEQPWPSEEMRRRVREGPPRA